MADQSKTIDQLPEKSKLLGTDMIPVDDGVQSYKVLWSTILKAAGGIKSITTSQNETTITLNDGQSFKIKQSDPGKQDKLTFDTAPAGGSTNPVTSGGVFAADNAIAEKLDQETGRAQSEEQNAKDAAANAQKAADAAKAAADKAQQTADKAQKAADEAKVAADKAQAAADKANAAIEDLGLTIVDGTLCVTYEE